MASSPIVSIAIVSVGSRCGRSLPSSPSMLLSRVSQAMKNDSFLKNFKTYNPNAWCMRICLGHSKIFTWGPPPDALTAFACCYVSCEVTQVFRSMTCVYRTHCYQLLGNFLLLLLLLVAAPFACLCIRKVKMHEKCEKHIVNFQVLALRLLIYG